ncbi:Bug family tripartite tricarboxylate transporter substrate binding protein [Alicycliphilus denitrificans]|uniref:Bug family tripartite tricarboxylate transporter substrate binding protein n=1 Tax=Alicycliphilus denitrificans TaxID=179636 RepID=UPI00095A692E|nr:tripartite tricarboxylate transporter substrate binding protein [Alicycliphilus denitrificans]MBN9575111.1 tripartite tricarboxylate transporter substrate binding protein [Alicycliphilus denitrificans]OJW84741.1 MAG: twin-arginine translocation pathway signal [Alicycliphilus sp. 69-12]HRO81029.1 tripartite tricarboxylate transporter substrate binding protein [Alicycliphilus denitrificans]
MHRSHFLRAGLGAALLALAGHAAAQTYPAKPVRMVIPFPPGGTLDAVGRMLAQKLGEQMGQPFVVENKPGGNGVIGADIVAKAPADGYTLLFNASTFTTAPMTMKSVPYSVTRDFAPVALVAKAPLSVAINKNLPITDIRSLIAHARAHPGKMTFAVGSIGSAGHLSTELLKRAGQIDYLVVPYKGTAPAFQDLIGGQIDGFIDPILGSLQYHKSGMLRVVAVTSAQRAASLPDVPTVAETIPGYEFYSWYGLWAPAKAAPEIVQRLNAEVNKALAGGMKERLQEQGLLLSPGSAEDFARFQRSDMERAQKIVTEGGIRVE